MRELFTEVILTRRWMSNSMEGVMILRRETATPAGSEDPEQLGT